MDFKMCDDCIKAYGEFVAEQHPPVVIMSDNSCCGDPDDCLYAETGECDFVED